MHRVRNVPNSVQYVRFVLNVVCKTVLMRAVHTEFALRIRCLTTRHIAVRNVWTALRKTNFAKTADFAANAV